MTLCTDGQGKDVYRHERVQIGHNLFSNKEKLQIIKCGVIVGMVNVHS